MHQNEDLHSISTHTGGAPTPPLCSPLCCAEQTKAMSAESSNWYRSSWFMWHEHCYTLQTTGSNLKCHARMFLNASIGGVHSLLARWSSSHADEVLCTSVVPVETILVCFLMKNVVSSIISRHRSYCHLPFSRCALSSYSVAAETVVK